MVNRQLRHSAGTDGVRRSLALVLALASLLAAGACASGGAVPRPFPTAGGAVARPPEPPDPAGTDAPAAETGGSVTASPLSVPRVPADGRALSGTALSLRGAPYRNGGTTPAGFDCSGFVQYVFALHGFPLPRETKEQFRVGSRVKIKELRPGDLVFFTTIAPGASHVGIVIGRDQFVHAPTERGVVRVERLSADYWRKRFIGARRPSSQ